MFPTPFEQGWRLNCKPIDSLNNIINYCIGIKSVSNLFIYFSLFLNLGWDVLFLRILSLLIKLYWWKVKFVKIQTFRQVLFNFWYESIRKILCIVLILLPSLSHCFCPIISHFLFISFQPEFIEICTWLIYHYIWYHNLLEYMLKGM